METMRPCTGECEETKYENGVGHQNEVLTALPSFFHAHVCSEKKESHSIQ